MARHIIFIDNFDSFSYNLVYEFKVLGCVVDVYRNDVDTDFIRRKADALSAAGEEVILVLSPGPSAPQDAHNLLPIIKACLNHYPMLGICLGHQALGMVLGGKVCRADAIVHGKSSLIEHHGEACFKGMDSPLQAARYHSLIVKDLPPEVKIIATADNMCMALCSESKHILGLQFHPESIMTTHGRQILKQALHWLTQQ